MTERASCRSCGAAIIWATTVNGKPMPVDAEPVPNGNIELEQVEAPLAGPIARYVKPDQTALFAGPRHVSHFATCPDAAQHRKATT